MMITNLQKSSSLVNTTWAKKLWSWPECWFSQLAVLSTAFPNGGCPIAFIRACNGLSWRKGGLGKTASPSTTTWKEDVAKWWSASSPRKQERRLQDSSCSRGNSNWTLGGISSWNELWNIGMDCPGRWWSLYPWRGSRNDWMCLLVPWFIWQSGCQTQRSQRSSPTK